VQSCKVVHLSTVHPWTDNRVFARECRSLARHGYDVTLIAVAENPHNLDGVRVQPAPRTPNRLSRMLVGVPRAMVVALRHGAALYHLHDPELIPLIPFLRIRGARVIYDAHEDLPSQVLSQHYLPAASRRFVSLATRALCWFAGRASSHVIAATPVVARRFPASRTTVLHNYPELLPDVDSTVPYESRNNVAIYTGGITEHRGVVQMVDAMHEADLGDWKLLLAGSHSPPDLIADLSDRPGWRRIDFKGLVPPIEARRLTSSAKVGLVVLQPTPAYKDALPTKMFEYMAAGIPVIASDFPLWRSIVDGIGCGLLVDPYDPAAIGRALRELAQNPAQAKSMGDRGRNAVLERLNWDHEERSLAKVYAELLDSRSNRRPHCPANSG
jgi:glycosyltransferase involved in cell wall biosynthesis